MSPSLNVSPAVASMHMHILEDQEEAKTNILNKSQKLGDMNNRTDLHLDSVDNSQFQLDQSMFLTPVLKKPIK